MARKSRKNMMPQAAVQEAVQQNEKELLRTAAYARLSVENGGHETEDSLHTQILQIHNYIRENPELTLTDTYADNGFTGTRFDRPEFERMMQDVRTGKIQCIVVKDLSRFGRDYIETGSYLETIFPMLHVRFIAINDDFDNIRQSDVDSLAVPIKNMVAMDQIHHLVSTMCEEEKLVKDMMRGSNLDSARSIKMKENSILFRIQEAEERRLRLYEDYKAEILDEDEYSQLKEHYIAEKQRLEHELQKQRQRALELEKRIKICDAQMERMRGILNQNEFDEELVHELIKRIYVGMDNSVEVEFKCSDPYQEVLAIMSEVQNE